MSRSAPKLTVVAEPIAVDIPGAGQLLGAKSEDWVRDYVLPNVKVFKEGRTTLILVEELKRFIAENSDYANAKAA